MNTFNSNEGQTHFVPLLKTGVTAEELAVGGSVVSVDARTLPDTVRGCLIGVKANSVRVTFDGTDPVSAGAGMIFAVGNYYWSAEMTRKAKFIESVGSSAAVVRIEPGS